MKDSVSSWQPSPATCHFITSGLSWNKCECGEWGESGAASFVTHRTVRYLAISLSRECFHNFMRVHFKIDSSLMHSSGLMRKYSCYSKWWKMKLHHVDWNHIIYIINLWCWDLYLKSSRSLLRMQRGLLNVAFNATLLHVLMIYCG